MPSKLDETIDNIAAEIVGENELKKIGASAMRPGLALAREVFNRVLDALEQHFVVALTPQATRRGRPPGGSSKYARRQELLAGAKPRSGWSDDPEERRREMARRRAKWDKNVKTGPKVKMEKPVGNHPRDPRHPDHDKWVKKAARARRKALAAREASNELKEQQAA